MHSEKKIRRLSDLPENARAIVVALKADQEIQGRLMGLGVFIGVELELLQADKKCPFRIGLGNTRIALSPEIADLILVEAL